jgi:hypothetical protein
VTKPTTPSPASNVSAGVRMLAELEELLTAMTAEHAKLGVAIDGLSAAMKALDLKAMDVARRNQEGCRGRIASMEGRRRNVVRQLARLHALAGEPKVPVLADLYPARRTALLAARQKLRDAVADANRRNRIASGLARSVLGHLNAAVRAFARAVDRPGTYTRDGLPRLARRIGIMEAVG